MAIVNIKKRIPDKVNLRKYAWSARKRTPQGQQLY